VNLDLNLDRVDTRVLDHWLLVLLSALTLCGLVAMGSASMEYAEVTFGSAFYHLVRQLVYLAIALAGATFILLVPLARLEQLSALLLLAGMALLALVLVPTIGREINGSQRWLVLGPLRLQPSELVKVAMVVYIAGYLVRRSEEVRKQWSGFLKPMVVMAVIVVLLLAEPDFGAVVVIGGVVMAMLFLGGARLSQFIALGSVCVVAGAGMVLTSEYRMRRIVAFTDPWADQYSSGYHLVQSLIAFGRGELFGVGLGNSVQKLLYLPEAHTDFVFAIWAEEQGAVGAMIVIALFAALVGRMLQVGKRSHEAGRHFGGYIAYGAALLIAFQVFINIGVNAGLLPTKGLTLPFFSYGGSSLIGLMALMALVLRVDYETRRGAAR